MLSNNRQLGSFQRAMQFPEQQPPQMPDMDQPLDFQLGDFSDPSVDDVFPTIETETAVTNSSTSEVVDQPFEFYTRYIDEMPMYASANLVAEYFDSHTGWFTSCANPMQAEPLGPMGYALTIGRFGAWGYRVEPKIGLNLLPSDHGVYRIETIPIPNYTPPGYEVDFQSAMKLVEKAEPVVIQDKRTGETHTLTSMTAVTWDLNLTVRIQFPKFIYRLPRSVLQTTGDQLLSRIVREVSRRLTAKVQEDFHSRYHLPAPRHLKLK